LLKDSNKKAVHEKRVRLQNECVENMKAKWLLAITLAVFLAASAAATQIQGARAATTRNFTLYGNYRDGWGFTASNITSPGPMIRVEQGDTVNLTLINEDGIATHRFFVSYTNSSSPSSGDPESSDFSGTTTYQFVATSTVGTYTYYCAHHPNPMHGIFQVVPTGTIPEFEPLMLLSLLVASTALAALVFRRKR
jgi:FtsP/CotA-like multicopper oxidase with cupredoxin domain